MFCLIHICLIKTNKQKKIIKTLTTVEQKVRFDSEIYSEICFHVFHLFSCVFPEAGFEPQDIMSSPGSLLPFSHPPVPRMLLRLPGGAVMPPHPSVLN